PSRCHRSTVAGCTSVTVTHHEVVHLVSSAIVKRCEPVNITRLRCSRLLAAASCCRRSSFSATSEPRERNCPTTNPTKAPSIAAEYQEEEAAGSGSAQFQKVARTGGNGSLAPTTHSAHGGSAARPAGRRRGVAFLLGRVRFRRGLLRAGARQRQGE